MFTDSGCLTTPLPLSLFYPPPPAASYPSQPPQSNTHTYRNTHALADFLSLLFFYPSLISLFPPICFTHMLTYICTFTHTHAQALCCVCFCALLATSLVETWAHTSGGGIQTEEVSILVVIFWTQPYDWNFACRREMEDLWSINTNRGAYAELHTIPCVDDLWGPVGLFFFILRFPHMGFSSVSLVQALRVCLQRWWQVLSHHFRSPRW